MSQWRRRERRQRREDARLGAAVRAIQLQLGFLVQDIDTYKMAGWTLGMPLDTPEDRGKAVEKVILNALPGKIRANLGSCAVDVNLMVFAIQMGAARLALPREIIRYILRREPG